MLYFILKLYSIFVSYFIFYCKPPGAFFFCGGRGESTTYTFNIEINNMKSLQESLSLSGSLEDKTKELGT